MLDVLHHVEQVLPALLLDEANWNNVYVNYHPPFVERLWCEWEGYRIYLHRIHPCEPKDALFHPHPWPSAMRVLSGTYEMGLGYGAGDVEPPAAATLILGPGSEYEMVDVNGWHYVRPLHIPTFSLMVTGKPWDRWAPKNTEPLGRLELAKQQELFDFFRSIYN